MGLLLGCSGCPGDGGEEETGASTSTSDGSGSDATTGSTSSDASTGGTTGETSATSTGPGTTSGSAETGLGTDGTDSAGSGASDSDTDTGSASPCLDDEIELAAVVLDITTNRVLGEDVAATFDPGQGSRACLTMDGTTRLIVDYGPFDGYPLSRLILEVNDGARTYDLAEDPGAPGSGDPGLIRLSYDLEEGATTYSFSTLNQAATGTVDVVSLPIDGSLTYEFDAAGEIAGSDGWQFDLHFTAVVPR